jgi:hypothetical protein
VKKRRQLLLRFREVTQEEIDDLRNDCSEPVSEFEDARGSTILLVNQLRDLTAALAFAERELASRGSGMVFALAQRARTRADRSI